MRIIDRYIFFSLFFMFFTTIMIFALLFVLIDSANNLDEFLKQQVPLRIIAQYYLAYLPVVLIQTAPIAALITVLLRYTHLNTNNELIALRASGMNFWRISRPALIFALLVSAAVLTINERYIPFAEERTKRIKEANLVLEADRRQKKQPVINNLTFYGLKNRLYFVDSFDPNANLLKGITIIGYDDKQGIKEKIFALEGRWSGLAWKFYQCHITDYSDSYTGPAPIRVYPEKLMDIQETPTDFVNQRLNINVMNIHQMLEYIRRFSQSGANRAVNNLKVDLYYKMASPFSTIIIIFVGLPLAMMSGRRKAQNFTALALAIIIGFLYYVLNAVGLALGKGGFLYPPLLAAWLAPLAFTGLGVYLVKNKF
jgi:lipopolysaccharide export system permease protein